MALYHLSMGYTWPSTAPTQNFTATLSWEPVQVVNGVPEVSNFNSLNDDDLMEFYVYDLANSGTQPALASTWITITPNGSDPTLFESESGLNSNVTLTSLGSMHSKGFDVTVPCFMVASTSATSSPLQAIVEQNDGQASGSFGVVLSITVTSGGVTGTFTSSDPTMIVNPG